MSSNNHYAQFSRDRIWFEKDRLNLHQLEIDPNNEQLQQVCRDCLIKFRDSIDAMVDHIDQTNLPPEPTQ
jgi:hypothetical protein